MKSLSKAVICIYLLGMIIFLTGCSLTGVTNILAPDASEVPDPTPAFDTSTSAPGLFSISSTTFGNGQNIPAKFTCDANNLSPALVWAGVPEGTLSLALIVDDPDAPGGVYVHWVLYNIPPTLNSLPEGIPLDPQVKDIGTQGITSSGKTGYSGPCPPTGKPHHYNFKLYALSLNTDLPEKLKASELMAKINGQILGQTQLTGLYKR